MRVRIGTQRVFQEQSGMILPLLLVLLLVGMLAVAPTLGHAYAANVGESIVENRTQELYAADAGLEEALLWLVQGHQDNANWDWDEATSTGSRISYVLNATTINVSVAPLPALGTDYYRVTSVASGPKGTTTVLSQVWVAPGALDGFDELPPGGVYDGDVYIDGEDTLQSNQIINGDVIVTGDLALSAQSDVDGSLSVGGDYVQHSHTTVTGSTCAGADVTMKAHSELLGDIYVQLDDGESSLIQFQGQAHAGNIYVMATGDSASVEIWLANKDVVGDIYVMPQVTLTTTFNEFSTYGTIDTNWDGQNPAPPDCPDPPGPAGAEIQTYEIL